MFCCPMCHGASYERLILPYASGDDSEVGMFQCSICRFGFYDPKRHDTVRSGSLDSRTAPSLAP